MSLKYAPQIMTIDGSYFDFLEPEKNSYKIETIAYALQNVCRFGGHSTSFYSVAQHCVLASWIAPDEYKYDCLMHDAAEAFLGDIPSPLKQLLPEFKRIEQNVEKVLFERYNVRYPLPPEVKKVDAQMLGIERKHLVPEQDDVWVDLVDLELPEIHFEAWEPDVAFRMFLKEFRRLKPVGV